MKTIIIALITICSLRLFASDKTNLIDPDYLLTLQKKTNLLKVILGKTFGPEDIDLEAQGQATEKFVDYFIANEEIFSQLELLSTEQQAMITEEFGGLFSNALNEIRNLFKVIEARKIIEESSTFSEEELLNAIYTKEVNVDGVIRYSQFVVLEALSVGLLLGALRNSKIPQLKIPKILITLIFGVPAISVSVAGAAKFKEARRSAPPTSILYEKQHWVLAASSMDKISTKKLEEKSEQVLSLFLSIQDEVLRVLLSEGYVAQEI